MNRLRAPERSRRSTSVGKNYHQCLDVDRTRYIVETIRTRFHQNHMAEAYELIQLAERLDAPKKKSSSSQNLYHVPSDVFAADTSSAHERQKPWRPRPALLNKGKPKDLSLRARKFGLAKKEEFTGTEAEALKKLLKTLRTKTWDPKLYFQIRFFSIRNQIHPMSQEAKILARQRWHFVLRMLSMMAKIEHALAEISYEKSLKCRTYIDMVESAFTPIFWGRNHDLRFEKDDFKATNSLPPMLSLDAQETLRDNLPEERTVEEIEQAMLSLQYVTDFAKLPVDLQHRYAEEGFYQWVGSKRVILRQGHVPQNFYFILLGQAMTKRFLCNNQTETTGILRKGDAFGSAAIFNNSHRLVTVVSQTPLHLLVIPKEPFLTCFFKQLQDPDDCAILFLSKMWFMQSWPVDVLIRCPSECCIKQFRRTEIIEAAAESSAWIYVIKTGTCQLYQRHKVKYDRQGLSLARAAGSMERILSHRIQCDSTSSRRESLSSSSESKGKDKNLTAPWLSSTKKYDYTLIQTLRHLDVFGLDDIDADSGWKPHKHLLLISEGAECVMLFKSFYQKMAGPKVRERVAKHMADLKLTYKQVTKEDCCLIGKGGIKRSPDQMVDPMQPMFCIHC